MPRLESAVGVVVRRRYRTVFPDPLDIIEHTMVLLLLLAQGRTFNASADSGGRHIGREGEKSSVLVSVKDMGMQRFIGI
jgi:hypothetical protein